MEQKEFNKRILAKMYEAAQEVWANCMDFGMLEGVTFTATELAKVEKENIKIIDKIYNRKRIIDNAKTDLTNEKNANTKEKLNKRITDAQNEIENLKKNVLYPRPKVECEKYETKVEEGYFMCSLSPRKIFVIIAKFEKLAEVKDFEKMRFAVPEKKAEVVATYGVEVSKDMAGLTRFCAKKEIRPIWQGVALDIDNKKVVATDGHKMCVKPLEVRECEGTVGECVVILAKEWRMICQAAGTGAMLIINKVGVNSYTYECNGITGRNIPGRYPNYMSVVSAVGREAFVSMDAKTWRQVKKAIKPYNVRKNEAATITQRDGKLHITVYNELLAEDYGLDTNVVYHATFEAATLAAFDFTVKLSIASLLLLDTFAVYVDEYHRPCLAVDGRALVLMMPFLFGDEEENVCFIVKQKAPERDLSPWQLLDEVKATKKASNKTTKQTTKQMKKQEENRTNVQTVAPVQDVEKKDSAIIAAPEKLENPAPAAPTTETTATPAKVENKKTEAAPAASTTAKKATAKKATPTKKKAAAKVGGNKNVFTFDSVGLKPGDTLYFVDGTAVQVAPDGMIMHDGTLYTMTGFCKKFMPVDRRCKSGAYRGPQYFTHDGVKVSKMPCVDGTAAAVEPRKKAANSTPATAKKAATKGKKAANKAAKKAVNPVAPAAVDVTPTANVTPTVDIAPVMDAPENLAPTTARTFAPWLRRLAVAAVALVFMMLGYTLANVDGTTHGIRPAVVERSADVQTAPAPVTATADIQPSAGTPVMGASENFGISEKRPFAASDLGARAQLAALAPGRQQGKG